ncbi:LuxR C-terminal-related transcriptional regulator [Amycolatopsis minnesotensis]|uniref:HTH luxR-type domain-containing protein n=1 Tax=Amycolatopsis minnesotensis TaxID=337894 RepID=A0ABN2R3J1_9PSEU
MTTTTLDRINHAEAAKPALNANAALAAARSEVLVMSSGTTAVKNPIAAVRGIDRDNLRRGVRYRVLVPDAARVAPVLSAQLAALSVAGAGTRTVPAVPTDALVIDRSVAVLPVGRTELGTPAGVAVFGLASVVTTTVELFERVWATAAPLSGSELPGTADMCAREQELLSLLAAGHTDAAAADRLGVSVRTVRRTVSAIMNRLGARSRFMAGVKAADRGLLT